MQLLALDPSYSRTGLTFLDTETRNIHISRFTSHIGIKRGFKESYTASCYMRDQVFDYVSALRDTSPLYVAGEIASPSGLASSSMWMLDTILLHDLPKILHATDSYMFHTSYLTFLHHKRYRKSESLELAKLFKKEFEELGYISLLTKRFTHDEAESFLLMTRLFQKFIGSKSISSIYPRIDIEKEISLLGIGR